MLKVAEGVFDRIEQSVILFKNNFLGLFLPFFVYNIFSVVIVGSFSKYYMMKMISDVDLLKNLELLDFLVDPQVILYIAIGIFLYLVYLLLYIVMLLGFIKSVKQTYLEEKITILDNITYGFSKFFHSMRTYWNIFVYVALIPSIIFIIGGILLNYGFYTENENLINGSYFILIISTFYFLASLAYRGLKSSFAIYNAVDKNDFEKDNFNFSIKITRSNWWRILGNFMLVGILVSIIGGMVGLVVGVIKFVIIGGAGTNLNIDLLNLDINNLQNPEVIHNLIINFIGDISIYSIFISNILDNITVSIFLVFTLIFTYLFYKRLELESKNK